MNRQISCTLILAVVASVTLHWSTPASAALTHRYSFIDNANDSVGSVHGTLEGGASISGGQVHLDGTSAYVNFATSPLPTGNGRSGTFEVWGTYDPETPAGSRIFDFSNSGNTYLYLTPNSTQGTPSTVATPSTIDETRFRHDDGFGEVGVRSPSGSDTGAQVLLTAVANYTDNLMSVYRDGVLLATAPMLTNQGVDVFQFLGSSNSHRLGHGQSVPPGGDLPGFLSGSISEFRIYDNALTPLQILTNAVAGPDVANVVLTDKTWNVVGAGNWNTDASWTAAGVPGSSHRAVIANGGAPAVSSAVPAVGVIRMTNGTININNGGALESIYPIDLSPGASSATINVNSGGRLVISGIVSDAGAGAKTLNIDGGTIQSGFTAAVVTPGLVTNIGASGATFDIPTGQMSWSGTLTGSGNITQTGAGTLVLRPAALQLGLVDQNPDFTGEFTVNGGTVDVQREHGVFGAGGSTSGGKVNMNDATLIINTAYPIETGGGFRKEFPADLHVTGENLVHNLVNRVGTELRYMGSLSGDGTVEFTKVFPDAIGIDFENRPNPDPETVGDVPTLPVDNSAFTGRIVLNSNWAVRFRGASPTVSGEMVEYHSVDFPNAIFDVPNAFAWVGKRGNDPNQLIRLGGLAGGAAEEFEDETTGQTFLQYTRMQASIAGAADDPNLAPVTYQLGGASQDASFGGIIQNGDGDGFWATNIVSVTKVGDNTQAFTGPLTYSGPTTINGGTLLVNGQHSTDAREVMGGAPTPADAPQISDYTVNSGGTLGGTGLIGSAGNPINVNVTGGTLAPGESVGDLTVTGNVSFDAASHFAVEISGNEADLLALSGALSITAGSTLDILPLGGVTAGNYTIATFGSRTGEFALNAPDGFSVSYATAGQIILTAPEIGGGGPDGDFNGDGVVDAADYTVWRDSGGMPAEFNEWKSNFGAGGSGSALTASAAVPEPSSLVVLLMGVALAAVGARRR